MGGAPGTQREHEEVDWEERGTEVNVGQTERIVSGVLGGTLAGLGLRQGSLLGIAVAAVGGALLYRGVTGRCPVYAHYGLDTTQGYDQLASRLRCQGGRAGHATDAASEASLDDALKATFPASDPATSY